jgi:response regulator RpfG family c-di-GMP phosphodiesterase/MFS family permease
LAPRKTALITLNSHYAAAVSAGSQRSGTADVAGGGRSVTVLVVDDNEVAVRLCQRVLEKAGHKVLTASDGQEAVSLALANSPDIILLDDAMPGMASLEAMRRIKVQRPGIAIVIAGVHLLAGDRQRFLAAGADDVLSKPFRLVDLTAVVAKLTSDRGPQMKFSHSKKASITKAGTDGAVPAFRQLSPGMRLFVGTTVVASLAIVVAGFWLHPLTANTTIRIWTATFTQPTLPILIYLAIGTQIAALLPIRRRHGVLSFYDPILVATGLFAPGGAVGLVAWIATFDGRLPNRGTPLWTLLFNRANYAIANVIPSLLVSTIPRDAPWGLPFQTGLYVVASIALNYVVAARVVASTDRSPFWITLMQNVRGASTLVSTVILDLSGGILFLLVMVPVGLLLAPAFFGFILAVRGTVADAQRQAALKGTTLELAAQALDARDRYTASHSMRVADLAGRLGEHLGLGDREVELLQTAGSLHDLGMIGVRDDILNKAGPLTDEEWAVMRRHPDIGADLIVQHPALAEVAPLVRHHHELWNGTGYPAGLKGDVIPFGARILSVADVFDTLTNARVHLKTLMTPIEAVEDISRRAAQSFDPNVVDALRGIHGLEPLETKHRQEMPHRVRAVQIVRSNPAFRNLIGTVAISSLGDPLTQVAALVTIFLATRDARAVALAFIAQALGTVLMSTVLGGVAGRFPRRGLAVGLELLRAGILVGTAFEATSQHWWLIMPVVFSLACINAIIQPARQAAIPSLVPSDQVGKANAIVALTTMVAGAIGFVLAGGLLLVLVPKFLFIAAAATLVLAAVVVLGTPSVGGEARAKQILLASALGRSWAISAVRPHLVIGGLAAVIIPISYPALVALAYSMSTTAKGGPLYSTLEVVLSTGIFAGSFMVSRLSAIGTIRNVGGGLLLTGVFSLAISTIGALAAPSTVALWLLVVALFSASVGFAMYSVANQTGVVEAANPSDRATVMAGRFAVVQTATIVGVAVGGVITSLYGAGAAYGVLGTGLILLGAFAFGASRRPTNLGGALNP